jgi:hypothetical protein
LQRRIRNAEFEMKGEEKDGENDIKKNGVERRRSVFSFECAQGGVGGQRNVDRRLGICSVLGIKG